jgi:hypothetical protein
VALDSSGNVYVAGYQNGTSSYAYESGSIYAQGGYTGSNAVLVKYSSSGTAQWATTPTSAGNPSQFTAVVVSGSGQVYAVGSQDKDTGFTYGPNPNATGIMGAYASGSNALMVRYNSDGVVRKAWTVVTGSNVSTFNGVAIDSSNNVYAVGAQTGTGAISYATGVSATGASTSGTNSVVVQYK